MSAKNPAIKMDELLKRLFHLSKKSLINLLNALYDDHLDETVQVDYGNTEFIQDDLVKSIADTFINISFGKTIYRYHIEFQTTYDQNIVIRMFRYGFEKAKETLDLTDLTRPVEMEFPSPWIIFIEENQKIPDTLQLKIKIPQQETLLYQVPVLKYWLYDPWQLYRQEMHLLLPLQVFKIRKYIKTRGKMDEVAHQSLVKTAEETIRAIGQALEEGKVTLEDAGEMNAILVNIMEYLYGRYGDYRKINQEVKEMIKTFYDPKLVEEGKIEGKIEKARDAICKFMVRRFNEDYDEMVGKIQQVTNPVLLDNLMEELFAANTKEEAQAIIEKSIARVLQ
jgi:hypothetical protein